MGKEKAWERGKRGAGKSHFSRRVGIREIRPRILIVCEGEKTEPSYFRGFRLTNVDLEIAPAKGVHVSVVQYAVDISKSDDNDYEEIWCVFDRDKQIDRPNDLELFNKALINARNNNINLAYSNDAFELWYLLHFHYYDTAISRTDYIGKLEKLMNGYAKNDPDVYKKLEGKIDTAIKNAKKLYDLSDKSDPAGADPSTTVFKLVERLKEFG